MLEGLAAWILNTYIGEYLENVNTDQLSIGLLQGEVELENLPLKKNAFKYLGLPIEACTGFVKKVKLRIPVTRLRSEPWIIFIEGLYLVAGPVSLESYDESKEQQVAQERKISRLDELEAKWKAQQESKEESSYYAYSYSNWLSFGTSLVANIIENIQIVIKDVHIRYEDEESDSGSKFACGVIVRTLTAQSADEDWNPKFVTRSSKEMMYNLIQLDDLAVYWDNATSVLRHLENQELANAMQSHIDSCSDFEKNIQKHEYILEPVNARAKLKRNCVTKPLRSRSNPRVVCDLVLEKIPLVLTESQYRQIVLWERNRTWKDLGWKYRRWRPHVPIKNNAKKWWDFAIQAHMEPVHKYHQSHTWNFVLQRARDLVSYTKIYYAFLTQSESVTTDEKFQKDALEQELTFEELFILRELVTEKIEKENILKETANVKLKGQGVLQRWFPGWSGWYSSSPEISEVDSTSSEIPDKDKNIEELKSQIEEEILDVLDSAENDTLLKRDTVFAQLNFSLLQGSFTLLSNTFGTIPSVGDASDVEKKPFIELEFSNVKTTLETRPRTSSLLFDIKLGAMYLHDRTSPNNIFSSIIAPQNKDISFTIPKPVIASSLILSKLMKHRIGDSTSDSPLFELLYEKRPIGSSADHRLIVHLHSMDIIYNPHIIKSIIEFFFMYDKKGNSESYHPELKLSSPHSRYEVLKQQTKAELRQKLDQILEGEDKSFEPSRWEIEMALSAPQIIVPENIKDINPTVVIFDFGKLQFLNTVRRNETFKDELCSSESLESDDEDYFITPCSTPQEGSVDIPEKSKKQLQDVQSNGLKLEDSEADLSIRDHLYESYTLNLSDMQVLVSRIKDNWKFSQFRGTSTMHVLDRFSISIQMERRLVNTSDPQWPSITLSGNLPKLVVHVSEQKVQALLSCITILRTPIVPTSSSHSPVFEYKDLQQSVISDHSNEYSLKESFREEKSQDMQDQQLKEESLLLLMQFCVNQMSFDVQSRGRSVAEVQVTGVKTTFSKRTLDTSATLCVHSLLLVDALQTYGPDFELLIASHKHVSMDSTSGSLKDSEPNSPTLSPSPEPSTSIFSSSPLTPLSVLASSVNYKENLHPSSPLVLHPAHPPLAKEPSDSDALIMVEFVTINNTSSSETEDEPLQICNVQFNNLDVIANQETIVELVGFMKRIYLQSMKEKLYLKKMLNEEQHSSSQQFMENEASQKKLNHTEITFDFHRLNVLLLRAVSRSKSTIAQKIATATLSGARIQASVGADLLIHGTLGGLQVLDLITEGTKHQRVISVGYDPLTVQDFNQIDMNLQKSYPQSLADVHSKKALTFSVTRKNNEDTLKLSPPSDPKEVVDITVRMASLCYTHSPQLLFELSSCATEFKEYMTVLANSIKSAAAEVAMGIVTKRSDSISSSFRYKRKDISPLKKLRSKSFRESDHKSRKYDLPISDESDEFDLRIDILLETPVVIVPSTPVSHDVFIAHLGRIAVQNTLAKKVKVTDSSIWDPTGPDTIFVEVKDMNLYSLNIDDNITNVFSEGNVPSISVVSSLPVDKLYDCSIHGKPVLHNTVLEFTYEKLKIPLSSKSCDNFQTDWLSADVDSIAEHNKGYDLAKVTGKVVNSLKVVLSKQQYQQLLKTLDNVSYNEMDTSIIDSSEYTSGSFKEDLVERKSETQLSISSLKLDEDIEQASSSSNIAEGLKKTNMAIQAYFILPDFIVELTGNFGIDEQSLVNLTFKEFILNYKKEDPYETTLQITLNSLMMEDLQEPTDSKRRHLMLSSSCDSKILGSSSLLKSQFLSSSCPDMTDALPNLFVPSSSLPNYLQTQNLFSLQQHKSKMLYSSIRAASQMRSEQSYPSTPPPSPSGQKSPPSPDDYSNKDALVNIYVLLVDKRSPDFNTKHNSTNRFVNIDFNCLDTIINLQTWVMVLDFFDIGSQPTNISTEQKDQVSKLGTSKYNNSTVADISENDQQEVINTELELTVCRFTVTLNKPEYEISMAKISNFFSHLSLRDGNFTFKGKLGGGSLMDLTPYGKLYPEKFVTSGTEALHFHIFKHGKPDPDLLRDYDISLKCQMSSVHYVHTNRFQAELTTFFQHFNQMQNLVARIRAAGSNVIAESLRGSRISLDITAGSPVIIVPQSYCSTEVLVANLGRLTVHNKFMFSNSPGAISTMYNVQSIDISSSESEGEIPASVSSSKKHSKLSHSSKSDSNKNQLSSERNNLDEIASCLLDVVYVELVDMDLYSAMHYTNSQSAKSSKRKEESKSNGVLVFPSFTIVKQGTQLLQEKFMLRIQLERNLDSAVSHIVPDMTMEGIFSSVHFTLDLEQYKLIRGILLHNLGEPLDEYTVKSEPMDIQNIMEKNDEHTWIGMAIHMDLVNVTLEIVQTKRMDSDLTLVPLAKFDFIKSRLTYESYSDGSKDIDLVSNEIRVSDTRYKDSPVNSRPNVFTAILYPTSKGSMNSLLQAEIHYRVTRDLTRFTILLNNMRVMGIFDWLKDVLEFISTEPKGLPQTVQLTKSQSINQGLRWKKSLDEASADSDQMQQSPFEMKLNVTDTEFVIVENSSAWDTNSVILKTTAVITWKKDSIEKPLSCSLQSLEVFSCILGLEDDTALSIIDPVTVSIDINKLISQPTRSLSPGNESVTHILEISMLNFNIRLSYYDMTMFLQMFESIQKQTGIQLKTTNSEPVVRYPAEKVFTLMEMGFNEDDCYKALDRCKGVLNEAGLWLTQNAVPNADSPLEGAVKTKKATSKKINVQIVEVRIACGGLCIIDDCRGADVPVIEITLSDFLVYQHLSSKERSLSTFIVSGDYYNRALSGWEPFIEPWRCDLKWNYLQDCPSKNKIIFNIEAEDTLNFNITSALLDLYSSVKKNWTEDYFSISSTEKETTDGSVVSPGCYKRRSPFIPYALKNDTGCKLWFATTVTSDKAPPDSKKRHSSDIANKNALHWIQVQASQVVPFSFEERGKMRHGDSHELKIHQIMVRVDGWQPVDPVSVDRVGVYFRDVDSQMCRSSSVYPETCAARIVFSVTLEKNASKLITVRSALVVTNKLSDPVELKLELKGFQPGLAATQTLFLVPGISIPLPLQYVHSEIWARPAEKSLNFGNYSISWHQVTRPGDVKGNIIVCSSIINKISRYRFNVCVKRENYPVDRPHRLSLTGSSRSLTPPKQVSLKPGHRITFIPPVEIRNLLPYELHFNFVDLGVKERIKPGKTMPLYHVDLMRSTPIEFTLENFPRCNQLMVSYTSHFFRTQLELFDNQNRILFLQVRVFPVAGGAVKIHVSAPYWLVNKTGLPLLFRQEGTQFEAAGQFEEHELARSMAPLLFSFGDRDAPAMCNMRAGRSLHPDCLPVWCSRFHLNKGIRVQQLYVQPRDSRPDWVYIIGIDVRVGRGSYRDTNIVTLSPRYYLQNRSRHKLEFAQKFATKKFNYSGQHSPLIALQNCSLPFHWPRLDLDNLLCVKLADIKDCHWSGGFTAETINSFHVNMRDDHGKFYFLRVEVSLQRATYFITYCDTDKMPPPFRVDNHSEVPITFYQTHIHEERLKTVVKANSSMPYAWDEPTLQPCITAVAPGGSSAVYNMNTFGEGSQLYYENFIYIAFTGTFLRTKNSESRMPLNTDDIASQELVLDVPQGTRVVLSRKEPGQRSQLWRMTSYGVLHHEGSSPPSMPRKSSNTDAERTLVLDIAGLGPVPGEYIPLMLRKPDPRRKLTQTWKFTNDGRLCCGHPNMFVQAKDGFSGISVGNDVVLGPNQLISSYLMDNSVPIEQAVSCQKFRKGSGVLALKVIPDGPTRVLCITDIRQKQLVSKTSDATDWVVLEEQIRTQNTPVSTPRSSTSSGSTYQSNLEDTDKRSVDIQLGVNLSGVGISFINHLSEELIYMMLHKIHVEYVKSGPGQSLDGSIKNIQIDNQLRDAERQVVLFLTPPAKKDQQKHLPAIHLTVHKVTLPEISAHIFKHLIITMRNVSLHLEEKLLLMLLHFFGYNQSNAELEKIDENDNQLPKPNAASVSTEWFYFSILKLSLLQVRLTVLTSGQLPSELQQRKQKMSLRLIKFEDAIIELDPFLRVHPFETLQFLLDNIVLHYKEELKSQAAKILGAVDFLGNPLGFMYDVSDGISELINEGNVGGLIKNVAHGLSDSAAKVTGSLSDGLGIVAMDNKHQEIRKRIRSDNVTHGGDHLMAGLKGLGFGLFGGMTSLITQAYEGAATEGVQGLISGIGKGLVGTVAKPAVGFLDFASGAASAVRDTSRRSHDTIPNRCRPPRRCVGPGGLLIQYSLHQACGQEFLYLLNDRNYNELFIAKEMLRTGEEEFQVLISNEQVYILSCGSPAVNNVVFQIHFNELYGCTHIQSDFGDVRYYLQLTLKAENSTNMLPGSQKIKRPQFRCDSKYIAEKVAQEINYAKSLYEERSYTVIQSNDDEEDYKS